MGDVEPGVVLRQEGIAAVAENRLDKIEIACQAARREETDLHPLFRSHAFDRRADERPQQQRHERFHRLRPLGGIRQGEQVARRLEGVAKQAGVRKLGRRLLVGRNRQAPFADVKRAACRTAIVERIVQHAVPYAVGENQTVAKRITVDRQRQFASHAMAAERQGLLGQPQCGLAGEVGKVFVQEPLDPPIGRTAGIVQEQQSLAKRAQELLGVGRSGRGIFERHGIQAAGDELQIDVPP